MLIDPRLLRPRRQRGATVGSIELRRTRSSRRLLRFDRAALAVSALSGLISSLCKLEPQGKSLRHVDSGLRHVKKIGNSSNSSSGRGGDNRKSDASRRNGQSMRPDRANSVVVGHFFYNFILCWELSAELLLLLLMARISSVTNFFSGRRCCRHIGCAGVGRTMAQFGTATASL